MKKALSIVMIFATILTLFCSCKSDKPIQWGDYEYVVLEDNTAKITKYIGTQEVAVLEIPSAIDEYTVTVIGKEAFKDVQCIRKVYTPDTLTTIEEYAFANSSIKNALMNRSKLLTDIGAYAFSECKNLLQADMPMSLVNLGDYAFYYCDKLKTAQFRGDPESIGTFTFDACPKVTIHLKSSATKLQSYVDTYHFSFKIVDPVKK
ncbi:MAG: leucine-rich repeat domain-containing protein [Clostridia bacterium]|nr:leucine-rich repeat domain-containing protein [Clostridia bacterium]